MSAWRETAHLNQRPVQGRTGQFTARSGDFDIEFDLIDHICIRGSEGDPGALGAGNLSRAEFV